jgi:hypothetical protein
MRKNALFGAIFRFKKTIILPRQACDRHISSKNETKEGFVVLVLGDDAWFGFYRGFQASLMLQGVDLLRDRVVRAKKEKEKEKKNKSTQDDDLPRQAQDYLQNNFPFLLPSSVRSHLFLSFPHVCPEPVLAKCSFLYRNGSKTPFFAGWRLAAAGR